MSSRAERSFSRKKFLSGQWHTRAVSVRSGLMRLCAGFLSLKRKGVDDLAARCFPFYKVVDFGSGRGAYSRWFIDRCPCTVLAVDWSPEALKWASYRSGKGKVLPVCADLHMLPFKHGIIDSLFTIDALGHLRDQEKALDEIFRVCRPGAALFLHSECGDYKKRWPDNSLIRKIGFDYLADLDGHYSIRPSEELYSFYSRRFKVRRFFSPAGLTGWITGYPEKYRLAFKKARFHFLNIITELFTGIKKFPVTGLMLRLLNASINKFELLLDIKGGGSCFAYAEKPFQTEDSFQESAFSIDIIIPTFNRPDSVYNIVQSLLDQCNYNDTIYIVWQGDQKPDVPLSERVHLLFSSPPNLPNARNAALKAGYNPVVLFLDDDIVPESELLDKHRNCYRQESTGAVAGFIEDPVFASEAPESDPWFDVRHGEIHQNFSMSESRNVISIMGANMSFRRSALVNICGFDKGFRHNAHWEDVDCAFRLLKSNYQIWYCHEARVKHLRKDAGGCRSDKRYRFLFHSFANTAYFSCKYAPLKKSLSWIVFWKYRLEYLSRKVPEKGRPFRKGHNILAVIAGLLGASCGLVRFLTQGKRTGLPQQIIESQESP